MPSVLSRGPAAIWAALLTFLALLPRSAHADDAPAGGTPEERRWEFSIRLEPRLVLVDGSLEFSEGAVDGTRLDLDDELGFDDSEFVAHAEIGLSYRHFRIEVDFETMSLSGTETLDSTEAFNGFVLPAGDTIDSEYDIHIFGVTYGHVIHEDETTELVFLAGLRYFTSDIDVDSALTGEHGDTLQAVYPEVGLRAHWDLSPQWSLQGEVRGTWFPVGSEDVAEIQVKAGVEWQPTEHLSIGAGYLFRAWDISRDNGDDDDNNFRMNQHGPFLGITLEF